jgi:hypothetical protein
MASQGYRCRFMQAPAKNQVNDGKASSIYHRSND